MQNPIMVFDHINKTATSVAQVSLAKSDAAAQALADQRTQVTSSGGSPAR